MLNLFRPIEVPNYHLNTVTALWREQTPYNRRALNTGIVHFGPGRFFRGHLACIMHNYLAQQDYQEQRWGICGVSLKSQSTINSLKPQRFLYTLTQHSSCTKNRDSAEVIGSIKEIVNGRDKREYVLAKMTTSSVHLVTLTITQAGYCLDKNFNLDTANAEIAQDLLNPSTPTTAIGFIVEALRRRRDRALTPFTILSCDNLPKNGDILRKAVLTYTEQINPQLAAYIRNCAAFPNTVVDRIVPQEQESDRHYPSRLLQVRDRSPIITEPFLQFVVEDNFTSDRPKWENTGVIMTPDIAPFLYLKSRFLNAIHSFIACLAVRAGIEYIHEAIELPEINSFIRLLMEDIAAATPVPYSLCEEYITQVLPRLSNANLPDLTERIASETARKIGKYILPILEDAYRRKVSMKRLTLPIAAWLLAAREAASESGKRYHVKDAASAVSAIQEGATISGILGWENCEQTRIIENECDRALQEIQTYGLLAALKNYCDLGVLNETASA
ncbi:MAG: mannitol dehydrogenase family protein [Oscillatoriaceae cyanobacterium Prado104]|jgi:mannitol-1-phosphate/altronate dehydrogenase|nr:mannitol dehydrogenase family protein [Oscillatoriaceae cyanobacterium Prado104]